MKLISFYSEFLFDFSIPFKNKNKLKLFVYSKISCWFCQELFYWNEFKFSKLFHMFWISFVKDLSFPQKMSLFSLKLNLPVRVPFPIANNSLLKYLCLANLLFRAQARIPTSCTLLGQSSIPLLCNPNGDRLEIFTSSLRGNIMRRRNISAIYIK